MINQGLIIPFFGKESEIPQGWQRASEFDGRIPKHTPDGDGSFSGSQNHTHQDNHTHVIADHKHAFTLALKGEDAGARHVDNPPREICSPHPHNSSSSGSITSTTTDSSDRSWSEATSIPASLSVIYIRSFGNNLIPSKGLVWRQAISTRLQEFAQANNKFLIGALSGQDAGDEVGSDNHTHALVHTHDATHAHSAANSGYASYGGLGAHNGSETWAGWNHYHSVSFGETQVDTGETSLITATTETNVPPYKQLRLYTASQLSPLSEGDIVMTTGEIPRGWELISSESFYVRATTNGNLGNGGSSSHTHANIKHGHDSTSHQHSGTCGNESNTANGVARNSLAQSGVTSSTHKHQVSVQSADLVVSDADTAIQPAVLEPPTITVKYIKATKTALGGSSCVYQNFM